MQASRPRYTYDEGLPPQSARKKVTMRPSAVLTTLWLAASATAATRDVLGMLHNKAMVNLKQKEADNPPSPGGGQCSLETAARRRDWDALTVPEKKAYIEAVHCMFKLLSRSDKSWAAGARVRYDDWPAIHINQTRFIHNTGNFLTYHRYLTWTGYNGTQPVRRCFYFHHHGGALGETIARQKRSGKRENKENNLSFNADTRYASQYWNWFKYQDDPTQNPLMDGSDTSMGGNGAYFEHNGTLAAGLVYLASGPGGGNVLLFQTELQGRPPDGFLGLHSGGHHTIGGDNSDNFSSAVDPLFWFHHAMVDYVYWLWQALHPDMARDVMGTRLARDESMGHTLRTDVLEMGATGQNRKLDELLDTMGGSPACYVYEY
ncbi:hypothetical protein PG997_005529 [Apiospora hydei]|uniref:Tyrosinase copper-binding domain-containing protein n=1 Tax=Apiospora hydei TaxID=1337664 RepID=A0ABR1WQH0_9PEZI